VGAKTRMRGFPYLLGPRMTPREEKAKNGEKKEKKRKENQINTK
jgi:hypothetical protein